MFDHGWWRLAVGSWRLAVGGSWWRLAAVGSWRLVVGGDWWLVGVGGWRFRWRVGGWQPAAVGGWRLLGVGGGWRLAVAGDWWRSLGAVLKGAVLRRKQWGPLRSPLHRSRPSAAHRTTRGAQFSWKGWANRRGPRREAGHSRSRAPPHRPIASPHGLRAPPPPQHSPCCFEGPVQSHRQHKARAHFPSFPAAARGGGGGRPDGLLS